MRAAAWDFASSCIATPLERAECQNPTAPNSTAHPLYACSLHKARSFSLAADALACHPCGPSTSALTVSVPESTPQPHHVETSFTLLGRHLVNARCAFASIKMNDEVVCAVQKPLGSRSPPWPASDFRRRIRSDRRASDPAQGLPCLSNLSASLDWIRLPTTTPIGTPSRLPTFHRSCSIWYPTPSLVPCKAMPESPL